MDPHETDPPTSRPELTMFCFWNGWSILATEDGTRSEVADVFNMIHWLHVLASSRLYGLLQRAPSREHLLSLLDIYLAYVARNDWYRRAIDQETHAAPRAALASRLRARMETWTPPELPPEIADIAGRLLEAEGVEPPRGGWDAFVNTAVEPLDDVLLWPEGIPLVVRRLDVARSSL
jgi:hypothetical protein